MRTPLRQDEELIYQTRKHWFVLIIPSIIFILLIVLSYYVYTKLTVIEWYHLLVPIFSFFYIFYKYSYWRFDLWVVTNYRVIDEEGVLSINSKESPIDKINNVSYEQSLLGRILGYGNVRIQTAAEMGETSYINLSRPRQLKEALSRAGEMYKEYHANRQAFKLADAVDGEIGEETKECPYCAEKIKAKAKVCRYCKRDL
ncbi:MAG: hypothetical protein CVV24_02455 [Ignavibacteriae bacterium HGW-Ignavibacteriae-3]|nr:MAG: hypothetical protein CVV24_02455 [Ignavibacteriae bacterium HGW-Ignavibacteriae-3]